MTMNSDSGSEVELDSSNNVHAVHHTTGSGIKVKVEAELKPDLSPSEWKKQETKLMVWSVTVI